MSAAGAPENFGNSIFERAVEAPEDVVLTRSVIKTKGLQPEDLGVLVHVRLLPPGVRMTSRELAAHMRTQGWDMPDERFAEIADRLVAAGLLTEVAR
ncbi:hypothetical protein [Streptomyces cinereoruber]|uniref:hypothetical protein n=1 Tax=Streptomyces cinereoruber TaxID=67260 RepID=UPI003665A5BC